MSEASSHPATVMGPATEDTTQPFALSFQPGSGEGDIPTTCPETSPAYWVSGLPFASVHLKLPSF